MLIDPYKEIVILEGNHEGPFEKGHWYKAKVVEACLPGFRHECHNEHGWIAVYDPVKVLFLDLDEVLTGYYTFSSRPDVPNFCPTTVRMISEICDTHGYKIVLNSTWKDHFHNDLSVVSFLKAIGFQSKHIHSYEARTFGSGFRGYQTRDYLKNHPEVVDYLIIDDSCDFFEDQLKHLIHVGAISGMTVADFVLAKNYCLEKEGKNIMTEVYPHLSRGIGCDAEPYFIRYTKNNDFEKYLHGAIYNKGDVVYVEEIDEVVEFVDRVEPRPETKRHDLILLGPNKNVRVLKQHEIAAFGQKRFIEEKS